MMLRVNNEFLDFNQSVEQERKAKLFEEMDKINGDVSFEFEIELTSGNAKKLGFPFPDASSKPVYRKVDADLLNNEGQLVSRGFIKIERKIKNLFCSFFGGNSNWFAMLTGNMSDLRLSQYNVEQTEANIKASWNDTSGIVWPIVDTGALSTRSYQNLKTEDFTPLFYVKTLFFETFQQSGLKIAGELLNDWRYNNLTIASNGRSQEQIDNRSSYAQKNVLQNIASSVTPEKVTWDDDANYPYFDGSQDNFSLVNSRYTADIKMNVDINLSFVMSGTAKIYAFFIYVNGSSVKQFPFHNLDALSFSYSLSLNAGDYFEVFCVRVVPAVSVNVVSGTINIKPSYLYKAFASSAIPKWTKQQFVSQVLAIFNVIPAYDPYTKTVTFNLFEKLKNKEPIDISDFVESIETDYSEFISDYGRKNNFKFQETDIDNLKQYNISTFLKYGVGVIEAENEFIEESKDVLESDFASPISYINGAFQMSMERIPFVELEEDQDTTFGSVSDFGGLAQFNIADDIFQNGDLVRISDSTDEGYNGEWVVFVNSPGSIIVRGLDYNVNASGTITKLLHKFTTEDNVYLFLNIPDYALNKAGGISGVYINENFGASRAAIAYFNLLNVNEQINIDYKQGLSFGSIQDPLFYQRTLLQDYWPAFGRILNDPVKLLATCYLPWKIHNQIDFLRPIMIKTLDTVNLYYPNRERGYENSYTPCEIELIKLP